MSYQRKLIRQAQRLARDAQRAGGISVVTVYHDRNCGHWRGGPCDCAAVIGRARPVGRKGACTIKRPDLEGRS